MLIQIDKKERKTAREEIGGFSEPSKMPCYSWSIPAQLCSTGGKLAKIRGSVCYGCYALKGFYRMPNVKNTLLKRFKKLEELGTFQEHFIRALQGETLFRWFDSGDLQSLKMLEAINKIALATPQVKHWLPTKEHAIVSSFLKKKSFASNLTVRLSAYLIDSYRAPNHTGQKSVVLSPLIFSQTVENDSLRLCPSSKQGGKCLDCRNCWNKDIETIAYLKH